jgi:hypothetical protein
MKSQRKSIVENAQLTNKTPFSASLRLCVNKFLKSLYSALALVLCMTFGVASHSPVFTMMALENPPKKVALWRNSWYNCSIRQLQEVLL